MVFFSDFMVGFVDFYCKIKSGKEEINQSEFVTATVRTTNIFLDDWFDFVPLHV